MDYSVMWIHLLVFVAAAQSGEIRCKFMQPTNKYVCISQDVNVTLGNSFNIRCTIYIDVQGNCYWKQNDFTITATGRYSQDTEHNINWKNSLHCSLNVTNVQNIDNGYWTCGISAHSNNEGVTSVGIKVNVMASNTELQPKPQIIWHSENVNVSNVHTNDISTDDFNRTETTTTSTASNGYSNSNGLLLHIFVFIDYFYHLFISYFFS